MNVHVWHCIWRIYFVNTCGIFYMWYFLSRYFCSNLDLPPTGKSGYPQKQTLAWLLIFRHLTIITPPLSRYPAFAKSSYVPIGMSLESYLLTAYTPMTTSAHVEFTSSYALKYDVNTLSVIDTKSAAGQAYAKLKKGMT